MENKRGKVGAVMATASLCEEWGQRRPERPLTTLRYAASGCSTGSRACNGIVGSNHAFRAASRPGGTGSAWRYRQQDIKHRAQGDRLLMVGCEDARSMIAGNDQ